MDKIVITSPTGIKTYLLEKCFYSIGRSPEREINIASDKSLSRWHATLSKDLSGNNWIISDGNPVGKHSTAGIFINSQKLPQDQSRILQNNDIIILTSNVNFVYYRGEEQEDKNATYH